MFTFTLLMVCVAAPPEAGPVHLARGQELVYRGKRVETAAEGGQPKVSELTTRLFGVEPSELAVATTVSDSNGTAETRFEFIDPNKPQAHDRLTGIDLVLLLDLPAQPLEVGSSWAVDDYPRPPRGWKVEAAESPPQGGGRCWKLRGHQQSENWDAPDGRPAWRQEIVAWIDSRTLIVQRIERVSRQREPEQDGLKRTITCFQLAGDMTYPDKLDAEVRAELGVARQAIDRLQEPSDIRGLDGIKRRLSTHMASQPKTEWRLAVECVEKQVDRARQGEVISVAHEVEAKPEWTVGRPAPDFVTLIDHTMPFRLADARGKPVVIGVVQSSTNADALRCLTSLGTDKGIDAVIVTATCQDHGIWPSQQPLMLNKGTVPQHITMTTPAGRLFGECPTPRFILIDKSGIVRQIVDGYGPEIPTLLRQFADSSGQAKASSNTGFDGRR